ncbi:MAG: glycoside hydrolase family 99-like domain-containing protein [Lentisphaeria bacterium]|nr:glycoside hydrolase family 99-like domain-containing protein [Lentisphaeria bacterium]
MKQKKEVFAVYFPSWHPDKHYEKWYGKGFCEWELLKTTKPLFEGHQQPKKPLWGYFDESSPEYMAKQIDLAADNGITGFMFDWYWYQGEEFLEKALNEAFLSAPNRNRLKFFLMWANHSWGIWPALDDGARGMNGNENQASCEPFLKIVHSEEDLRNVMEYCCEKYFKCENYWKIDGKPVYSVYNCNMLFKYIEPAAVLRIMNETAQKHGFPGIYTLMNIGCCNDNEYFCGWGRIPKMRDAGFDAVFAYNSGLRTNYAEVVAPDKPTIDYSYSMTNQRYCWERIAEQGLPFCPSITLGGDVAPRWSRHVTYPWDFEKLGYYPIKVNATPERVAELLKDALAMDTQAVIINAWNEWSEGMYLIPDTWHGTSYLDKIKEVLDNIN